MWLAWWWMLTQIKFHRQAGLFSFFLYIRRIFYLYPKREVSIFLFFFFFFPLEVFPIVDCPANQGHAQHSIFWERWRKKIFFFACNEQLLSFLVHAGLETHAQRIKFLHSGTFLFLLGLVTLKLVNNEMNFSNKKKNLSVEKSLILRYLSFFFLLQLFYSYSFFLHFKKLHLKIRFIQYIVIS